MVNKFRELIKKNKKSEAKNTREDLLTRMGREQLTRLNERGLDLPVALL